jgi:iron complex transport system substrate-binding protein
MRALVVIIAAALASAGACAFAADGPFPQRIVSLSPNLTEVLYGVGAFDQVVGISDYCTWPPAVSKLPSVGGWRNPNLERLTALRPDLVIIDDSQAAFVQDDLKALSLAVLVAADRTVSDVFAAISAIGRATGHPQGAARLEAVTRKGLARVARTVAPLPRPGVILIVDRNPGTLRGLVTAAEGSFLAELVSIAGGRSVAPELKGGYGQLSKEDLLAIDPDVILDFVHGSQNRFTGALLDAWLEMPDLKAVRERRVYGVNEDFVPHASQRIVETAELFARLIHQAPGQALRQTRPHSEVP